MRESDRFAAFYSAVYGKDAFPWQRRLVDEVLERGWTGLQLDLPTGSGKTTALDIALYCLSVDPARMPRRTLLVIDRRIVVDQAATHARCLLASLSKATSGPILDVAKALRALRAVREDDDSPFEVAVMRGGMPRDNDWARSPDQPVLGVSTVDQVGSRLLFRGYGVGNMSAAIHAGMLGNDTLILLDEVHLATAFASTLDEIGTRYRRAERPLVERFSVVPMSATLREPEARRRFSISPEDREHPVLKPRLEATKRARLEAIKLTGDDEPAKLAAIARRAVEHARNLQDRDGVRVVGIVLNRVDAARLAVDALVREHGGATSAILVTGRMRAIDRDRTVRLELSRAEAGRNRIDASPLIVVATQCIEAGADLDFDAMVTECASLDALRQRFGRVDRRGELGETYSVVLGRSDKVAPGAEDPVYGMALGNTWSWLQQRAADGVVDFGSSVQEPAAPEVLPPAVKAPVLLPSHLDAWAQTSMKIVAEPDVARWLHGERSGQADVQIIWRSGLGEDLEVALELLAAVRPSSLEGMTLPLHAARKWLTDQDVSPIADVVGTYLEEPERRGTTSDGKVALRWTGDTSKRVTASELKPGDVIVVDVGRGGIRHGSFDPLDRTSVIDVGDLAQLRGRGLAMLRLQRDALAMWNFPEAVLAALPQRDETEPRSSFVDAVKQWIETWPDAPPCELVTPREYASLRTALMGKRLRIVLAGGIWVVSARVKGLGEVTELVTEDDESSFRAIEVTLKQHSLDVRDRAKAYAEVLGLDAGLQSDLALAGWIHDLGKADPRFQRWLVGGDEIRAATQSAVLAKSALPSGDRAARRAARIRALYPDGYRHELLSVAMVEGHTDMLRRAHDPDLVLHLVGSHHGWCRPFAPLVDDLSPVEVAYAHGEDRFSASSRHELARLDRGIADRFWRLTRRYGWWGLAWLEAIVRLADHRASEAVEEQR